MVNTMLTFDKVKSKLLCPWWWPRSSLVTNLLPRWQAHTSKVETQIQEGHTQIEKGEHESKKGA
jgi:hypothetical protein